MTPTQLERAGRKIFGEQWRNPLARLFGVMSSTLANWRGLGKTPRPIPKLVYWACKGALADPEEALKLGLSKQVRARRMIIYGDGITDDTIALQAAQDGKKVWFVDGRRFGGAPARSR